jgi:hypothetical protein
METKTDEKIISIECSLDVGDVSNGVINSVHWSVKIYTYRQSTYGSINHFLS